MNKLQLTGAALFIAAAISTPVSAADVPADAAPAAPAMKCVDKDNNDVMKDGKAIMDDSTASKDACTQAGGHFVDAANAAAPAPATPPTE